MKREQAQLFTDWCTEWGLAIPRTWMPSEETKARLVREGVRPSDRVTWRGHNEKRCRWLKPREGQIEYLAVTSTLHAEAWHEDVPKVPSDHRMVVGKIAMPMRSEDNEQREKRTWEPNLAGWTPDNSEEMQTLQEAVLVGMQGEMTNIEEDYLEKLTEVAVRWARKIKHTTRDTRRTRQHCKSEEENGFG